MPALHFLKLSQPRRDIVTGMDLRLGIAPELPGLKIALSIKLENDDKPPMTFCTGCLISETVSGAS